jgi:hypothetical protein
LWVAVALGVVVVVVVANKKKNKKITSAAKNPERNWFVN